MVYSEEILDNDFVLSIYDDILEYSPIDQMDYTEKVLQEDIYFLLLAKLPNELSKEKLLFYPPRLDH